MRLRASLLALGTGVALSLGAPQAQAQLQPPPPFGPSVPGLPGAPGTVPPTGPSAPSATVNQLNEAESEDSGRRLELVYANADLGGGFTTGSGGSGFFGAGGSVGVRLFTFTLGARVRDYLGSSNLLLVNGELGYRLVLGSTDLLLGAHGGYAGVTNAGGAGGANVGGDIGFEYYLSSTLSLGVTVSPDAYFSSGTARFGLFVGPRLGLHFGL